MDHAGGFAVVLGTGQVPGWSPASGAELGSGGGLPGLPLALSFPSSSWVLIDANGRRAAFLREAVVELELQDRVRVRAERAEVTGRDGGLRGRLDVVVARGFGPPAVVAECAAPLLATGGRVVVSEPPGGAPGRWPAAGLRLLGLAPGLSVVAAGAAFQVLERVGECDERYPRRTGVPGKRPLF